MNIKLLSVIIVTLLIVFNASAKEVISINYTANSNADSTTNTTNADSATNATNADSAINTTHANNANNATNGNSANSVSNINTVIANPGEDASHSIRINWHLDINPQNSFANNVTETADNAQKNANHLADNAQKNANPPAVNYTKEFITPIESCITYTEATDTKWRKARRIAVQGELCTQFDSILSTTPDRVKIYERARFIRNAVEISNLKPGTKYMYHIDNEQQTRYFKTAPIKANWTAAIISDYHAYTPIPNRTKAAMEMLGKLESISKKEPDLMLHVGDITAWGGSYSFWKDMYTNWPFKNYTWAGVIGNHDHMSRGYESNSNEYFRLANNNPLNGYNGEKGICYFFKYGDALFIMLNNETMRTDEGLALAQEWVRKTIKDNPAKYIIVVEHYQWFFATNGKTSQYSRWCELFDECSVDLAIGANNHVYARTNALYQGKETDGSKGTVYVQTPSSDNERGQELAEWTDNKDIIQVRWSEGANTVGAMLMHTTPKGITLSLYNRTGKEIDTFTVKAKR